MKVRTGLFLLVSGAVVPVLLLALVLGVMLIDHERETFRRATSDRARSFLVAVDAAIAGHISTLQALSTSSNLATGNVAGFERRLARILDSQPDWEDVILATPDGRRIADAAHPMEVADADPDIAAFRRAVQAKVPAVGEVVPRGVAKRYGVAIHFPVMRGQDVTYVLSAILRPALFQALVEAQQFPAGWASGLVDANARFIARVPRRQPGELASASFREHLAKADEGWYRGLTVDGADTFTAFVRSPLSGWSIGVAIPADTVMASSRRAAWTLGLGAVVAIALAVLFAIFAGRRIAVPMGTLAAGARSLGRADAMPPSQGRLPFREMRDVEHALAESAEALAERQALREREQAALREADRAKDEFIAVLGHELRNPLSAIASSVKLLQVVPEGSAAAAGARDIIARQTRQMTRLVEDLMDISRLATGKLELQREPLDLGDLAATLVDTWRQSKSLPEARVRLEVEPTPIVGDRARLEQVIANLLDNATKFSTVEQPIEVRVQARGDEAVLEVQDHGDGIPPAMQAEIFRPFVQGPQAPHRPSGGLGLGLSVVQRLVALHGGRVSVRSAGPGTGATFAVHLPLAPL